MKTLPHRQQERAFSLVEVLLVATIMSVIVYGLYRMFDQTQRALRSNTTQVDVLEAARAAVEMISRDIEQCAVSQMSGATNLMARIVYPNANFFQPSRQALITNQNPAFNVYRTNFLQELLFLTRYKDNWGAIGFFAGGSSSNSFVPVTNGIGTLYRFSYFHEPPLFRLNTNLLIIQRQRFDLRTNASPLLEGVVHFSLKAFDPQGTPLEAFGGSTFPGYQILNLRRGENQPSFLGPYNVVLQSEAYVNGRTRFLFVSNAMPAYVELEVGILEPRAIERLKGFPQAAQQQRYLEQHAGMVHLFHKRIPIRSATP
ncbi:MAG TPA: prepilin-type N-terminal cleavage/methylation domain-containing protein [Candidatus Paceibacterota bacterium]|nr:prepilin-type N-terminal cleavage/methylation domain-containing protein [Verrucomicrobiota bacterium]HRY48183.1 prepilin-type N-terminal cleavage/methylation domain-containing protein [Candidatus Paceibacterota bacterium]